MSKENKPSIEIDVSGVFGAPSDAVFSKDMVDEARANAQFLAENILKLFKATLIECGVRKIIIQSVPQDDIVMQLLRASPMRDERFDYILTFEGKIPRRKNRGRALLEVNNKIMKEIQMPFIKEGKLNFMEGELNPLSQLIKSVFAPSFPGIKYPKIYMRIGLLSLD